MNRRSFLKRSVVASAGVVVAPNLVLAKGENDVQSDYLLDRLNVNDVVVLDNCYGPLYVVREIDRSDNSVFAACVKTYVIKKIHPPYFVVANSFSK